MNAPLITTILPTYQRPQLLARAIRSVQNQTFPHLKICIYDNASNDETENVVRRFMKDDPRIEYYCHPQNIGAVDNYVFASKRVETPFFSFFADDDVLLPDFYKTAYQALQETPQAGFFTGLTISCTQDGKVVKVPIENWQREGLLYPEEGLVGMARYFPAWTGILFRREVLEKVGPLDAEVLGHLDYEFQLRASAHFPFLLSKEKCAIYLSSTTSESGRGRVPTEDFWNLFSNKISNILAASPSAKAEIFAIMNKGRQWQLINGLKQSLKARDFQGFEQLLARASFLSPKKRRTFLLRRFIAKYLPFVIPVWGYYKKTRKAIKRLFKKSPTMLEELATKYGEYSKWLKLDSRQ